jgi:hypothetical protein
MMRARYFAVAVLWCASLTAAAHAQSVTFTDDFSRPDGAVGNGWSDAGNPPLVIANGVLTQQANPWAGVYRPVDYSGSVTFSATLTPVSSGRYNNEFDFLNNGTLFNGLGLNFFRGDDTYSDSDVQLVLDGNTIATDVSSFQFGSSIDVTATLLPNDSISGSVSEGTNVFDFNFGPQSVSEPGDDFMMSLVGEQPGSDPTIGDVSITTQGPAAGAVTLLPSGNEMLATFQPDFGLTLAQAAQIEGFDHYNWVQTVIAYPFSPLAIIPNNCFEAACPTLVPFIDPVAGGQNRQPADTLPFYWDEGSGAGLDPAYLVQNNIVGDNELLFEDIPGDNFLIPGTGEEMKFITSLVGVNSDDSWVPLDTFTWMSDFNPLIGGVATERNITPYPGGTGDVSDVQQNVSVSSLPTDVRALWVANGAVLPVPEPPTSSLFLFGLIATTMLVFGRTYFCDRSRQCKRRP